MGQCIICKDFLHPDWMEEKNIRGDDVNVCHFCSADRKELTVEDENGKVTEIVTKGQAVLNYKKYLRQLLDNPKIAEVIQGETNKMGM